MFQSLWDTLADVFTPLTRFYCSVYTTDVEWSLIYVGSADDKSKDQVLESVEVGESCSPLCPVLIEVTNILTQWLGPISNGTSTFMLEAPAPDMNRIPRDEMFGITILLYAS